MFDSDAALLKHFCDQQCTVAIQRLLLTTHYGNTPLIGPPYYTADTIIEHVRVLEAIITHSPIHVIAGAVHRTAAELSTKECIADPSFFQGATQSLIVEVGAIATGW